MHDEQTDDERPDEALARYAIEDATYPKRKWTLAFYSDSIELLCADGTSARILWTDRHERIDAKPMGLFARRMAFFKVGKKKVLFPLPPDAFTALMAWLGPPTIEDLKLALKKRFSWLIPIGVLTIVGSLPLGIVPADIPGLVLGIGLVATSALAKIWPHRVLFVFDALWFCLLAGNSIWRWADDSSYMRGVMIAIHVLCACHAFLEYHRFAPRPTADEMETPG